MTVLSEKERFMVPLERLMMPAGSASDDNDCFGDLPDPDPDDVRFGLSGGFGCTSLRSFPRAEPISRVATDFSDGPASCTSLSMSARRMLASSFFSSSRSCADPMPGEVHVGDTVHGVFRACQQTSVRVTPR